MMRPAWNVRLAIRFALFMYNSAYSLDYQISKTYDTPTYIMTAYLVR